MATSHINKLKAPQHLKTPSSHVKIIIIVFFEIRGFHIYLRKIHGRQPL